MAKSGNSVFPRQHRAIDVLGAQIRPIRTDSGTAIARRDMSLVLQHALGVGDRQARGVKAIFQLEDWTAPNSGLNSPLGLVNSVEARVQSHSARVRETRVQNGRRGGRPRKPLDTAPGSTGLANQPIVETATAAPQESDHQVWRLPAL